MNNENTHRQSGDPLYNRPDGCNIHPDIHCSLPHHHRAYDDEMVLSCYCGIYVSRRLPSRGSYSFHHGTGTCDKGTISRSSLGNLRSEWRVSNTSWYGDRRIPQYVPSLRPWTSRQYRSSHKVASACNSS